MADSPESLTPAQMAERLETKANRHGFSDTNYALFMEAAAMLRASSSFDGWRPIATAPKDGTYLLLWCVGPSLVRPSAVDPVHRIGNWERDHWVDDGEGLDIEPTHWMPLPEPPK